jgi:AraC family transcriptional regulator
MFSAGDVRGGGQSRTRNYRKVTVQESVEQAITTMWNRYGEPLTLTEIAASAMFSKFYFSRVFRSSTGVSPGRFLSVIRLHEAKKRLLETSLNVTNISYEVGYASLGTFTTRFSRSVGITPSRYRALSQTGIPLPVMAPPCTTHPTGAIVGLLNMPETDTPMHVYVGAFKTPIPEGAPASCDLLDSSGPFQLAALHVGSWYIQAIAVAYADIDPRPWKRRPVFVSDPMHVTVLSGMDIRADIQMRPETPFDLPVLLAVPELDGMNTDDRARVLQMID